MSVNRYQTHQICQQLVDGEMCLGIIRVVDSRPTAHSLRRRRRCQRCRDSYTTFEMRRTDIDIIEGFIAVISQLKKPLDAAIALGIEITWQEISGDRDEA